MSQEQSSKKRAPRSESGTPQHSEEDQWKAPKPKCLAPQLRTSEVPTCKSRHRIEIHPDQHSEEDQWWKFELRDCLVEGPREMRWLRRSLFNPYILRYRPEAVAALRLDGSTREYLITKLLELHSQDQAGDEAFAALMENAAEWCLLDPWFQYITLGNQIDYPYSDLTENSMPYLKKFLTYLPKNFKSLHLWVHTPEIFRTFPDEIGKEASALEHISIMRFGSTQDYDRENQEYPSLGNMLYATRSIKDVKLRGFYSHSPGGNSKSVKAFKSQTKRIDLCDIVICDQSPEGFLHPATKLSFERMGFVQPKLASWLNGNVFEDSKLCLRQLLHASKHTLPTITISHPDIEHFLAAMCFEAADQDLDKIKSICLRNIATDLIRPMNCLARSRVGSTLHEIDLDRIELSAASLRALFSNKTLESIKLIGCGEREFFLACTESFSSKLRFLDIWAARAYDTEHILRVLSVLPDLRRLTIDGVEMMYPHDVQMIASGIANHQKLCFLECFESKSSLRCRRDGRPREDEAPTREKSPSSWLTNEDIRLACLRNCFNTSEKKPPLGLLAYAIAKNEELYGESGIFEFLKVKFPSELMSYWTELSST